MAPDAGQLILDRKHCYAIENLLFGAEALTLPVWLEQAVTRCGTQYAGLSLTDEFGAAIRSFRACDEDKPFELFVVGEGKFGKSTLVNCLLGDELSKVRVLPETRCFLRYVLTDSPDSTARFYVRIKEGVHDWLLERLGKGQEVPSLFNVTEHKVLLKIAKGILAEEVRRLDAGGYEPAVLEVERDVGRTVRSAFKSKIRIVDTQGLDQLFPDELQKRADSMSEASGQELS